MQATVATVDDPLPVLRQAAAALLATAPLAVVRAILRALLAEEIEEQPVAAQVRTATPVVPTPQSTAAVWDTGRTVNWGSNRVA
jgi:hypothetical protein